MKICEELLQAEWILIFDNNCMYVTTKKYVNVDRKCLVNTREITKGSEDRETTCSHIIIMFVVVKGAAVMGLCCCGFPAMYI